MAVTKDQLESTLKAVPGFNVLPGPVDDSVMLTFGLEHYTSPRTGEHQLAVVLSLEENGEYIKVSAPFAFKAEGPHFWEILKACMSIQWKTKLVQFEYDENDGEIRAVVEWPIEDGTVTTRQLGRTVAGLVDLVERSYPVLDKAARTGEVDTAHLFG